MGLRRVYEFSFIRIEGLTILDKGKGFDLEGRGMGNSNDFDAFLGDGVNVEEVGVFY